jgi:serine/threonine protein kinase
MNTPNDPKKKPVPLDRTMVEGQQPSVQQTQMHGLDAGTKINVTSPGVQTAYGRRPDDGLPSGKDPIPLGSGKVVCTLGAGGMAKVYKIWNEKLEIFRAVKIIIPTSQTDLMSRFETEVKITAKLHHPNIVEIYSVGDWNGLPYLEMEFIDGVSLEAFIAKTERLPEVVCCAVAIFVARALEYAHSQDIMIYGKTYKGIVHRDLKPANVMIAGNGAVKLMDFGIARPTETSLHTAEGSIVGTLPYLAPEQIDGTDIDNRVDIYALGTILYEMLTGTKTFPQKSITNLMKNKITNEFRKFEEFDFRIHQELSRVAKKCLQVRREDRYADAHATMEALEGAHSSLTDETPEQVIKRYLSDPHAFAVSGKKKFALPGWLGLKVLVPAGAAVLLGGIVTVVLLTGPKQEVKAVPTLAPRAVASPEPSAPDTASSAADRQSQQYATGELKPLGGAPQPVASPAVPSPKPSETQSAYTAQQKAFKPRTAESAPTGNSREALEKRYKTTDLLAIGMAAVASARYGDAVAALEPLPDNHPDRSKINLLLLESYVQTGRTKDALYIVNSAPANSAEFELLTGKTYFKLGNLSTALDHFNAAMQKPTTIKGRKEVIDDALYNIALIRSAQYRANANPDTRALVMQAWFSVKQALASNPSDSRYKKAVEELADIR